MKKRWKARNGLVFNPLGGLHFVHSDKFEAQSMVEGLNADLGRGIKQTWMPGVSTFREDVLDSYRLKGFFKNNRRRIK